MAREKAILATLVVRIRVAIVFTAFICLVIHIVAVAHFVAKVILIEVADKQELFL